MKQKKDNKFIIFGLVVVVVLGITAIATIPRKKIINYDELTQEEFEAVVKENVDSIEINRLKDMGERDRIEYYASKFVSSIGNKSYEYAYSLLYDEYKERYFPTLEKFEEYAKTRLPSRLSLEYTNIERNGDVYVLWVTLKNPIGTDKSEVEMNFIIKENDLNDFVMSFSVI